jgi:flagellar biosynthetic protein FliQ
MNSQITQDVALEIINHMLLTAAKVAAPFLLVCLAIGLLVSIIQVATQIQEMTLTFIPKIIAAVVTLLILGSWMLGEVVEYARSTILQAVG